MVWGPPIEAPIFIDFYIIETLNTSYYRKYRPRRRSFYGKLRNNSWKPYVYIVFTTGRPLCHEVYHERKRGVKS